MRRKSEFSYNNLTTVYADMASEMLKCATARVIADKLNVGVHTVYHLPKALGFCPKRGRVKPGMVDRVNEIYDKYMNEPVTTTNDDSSYDTTVDATNNQDSSEKIQVSSLYGEVISINDNKEEKPTPESTRLLKSKQLIEARQKSKSIMCQIEAKFSHKVSELAYTDEDTDDFQTQLDRVIYKNIGSPVSVILKKIITFFNSVNSKYYTANIARRVSNVYIASVVDQIQKTHPVFEDDDFVCTDGYVNISKQYISNINEINQITSVEGLTRMLANAGLYFLPNRTANDIIKKSEVTQIIAEKVETPDESLVVSSKSGLKPDDASLEIELKKVLILAVNKENYDVVSKLALILKDM